MIDNPKIYYCYALLDPRKPGPFSYGRFTFTHEPFYIGKGHGNRSDSHTASARNSTSTKSHKLNRIRVILRQGLEPLVVRTQGLMTEDRAFNAEVELISTIGRLGFKEGPLINLTSGGTGMIQLSPSSKRRHQASQQVRFMLETSEEKANRVAKALATKAAHPEIEAHRRKAISEFNQKPESRKMRSSISKEVWGRLSEKEKAKRRALQQAAWDAMSPAERKAFSQRCAVANQRKWDTASSETREKHKTSLRESFVKDPTRAIRQANSLKKALAKKSPAEKALAIERRLSSTTPESRSAALTKAWETRRARKVKSGPITQGLFY